MFSGNPPLDASLRPPLSASDTVDAEKSNINIEENNDNEAEETEDEAETNRHVTSNERKRSAMSPSKMRQIQAGRQSPVNNDSTINLEIFEQLRSLGEEIRNDRFKKEQKQYIKHVVNKELNKSRIRSKYVPDIFVDADEEDANALAETQSNRLRSKELKPTTQSNLATNNINNESEQAEQIEIEIEQPKFRSRIRR